MLCTSQLHSSIFVALLAEGVDRNLDDHIFSVRIPVALLAEGVDRNQMLSMGHKQIKRRPPRGGRG